MNPVLSAPDVNDVRELLRQAEGFLHGGDPYGATARARHAARQAAKAPAETLAYVAAFDPARKTGDAIAVVDVDPKSASYSKIVGTVSVPHAGDEFHHFGWNACSSCLCPNAPHPHVERRYLVVPGLRSSRIYIFDTKPDPRKPQLVKTIEPAEIAEKTGYSRPHTTHCGPGGIYVTTHPGFLWHDALVSLTTKRAKLGIVRWTKPDLETLAGLIAAGEYRAVIDRTYPLEDVVEAHRYVDTHQKVGNVVLTL